MRLADKITITRMMLLPFVWIFALLNHKIIFVILLGTNFLGDILDGYFARKHGETEFGAKLDYYVDYLFYISIMAIILILMPNILFDNLILISILFVLILIPISMSYIVYKKTPAFHLISSKLSAAVGGLFFFHALFFSYSKTFLYIWSICVLYNVIEKMILIKKGKIDGKIKTMFE